MIISINNLKENNNLTNENKIEEDNCLIINKN